MEQSQRQRQFLEDGFVVLRKLFVPSEIESYVSQLKELGAGRERWTQPDGINRNPAFWPVIFNEALVAAMRELLGPDVRYLPHNDLHVGFSSFAWHRDNVSRNIGVGPDWDESREPYRLARVGIYLQRFADSQFKLGLVRGSHRQDSGLTVEQRRRLARRTSAVANVFSGLSGVDLLGADADWIATEPGDCIVFDPRILHTGSKIHGVKYSLFLAYGVENSHFRHHWHYYLRLRKDLGYSAIDPELARWLKDADLLAQEPQSDLAIEGAWIPTPTYAYVSKRFK